MTTLAEKLFSANQCCYSQMFVWQLLCINFAYANSYECNIINKTFLRTNNRQFIHKYADSLSCHTIEIFFVKGAS